MLVSSPHLGKLTLPATVGRSPGVHMSDLYNDFYQLTEPKRFDKSKPMDTLRVLTGLALEDALETALIEKLGPLLGGERPGELRTASGLPYTPDLIIFEGRIVRIGEIKCTWMSCRECPISPTMAEQWGLTANWDGIDPHVSFPQKFDKYFDQMMLYGYHTDTPYSRLFGCFINGDYHPPRPVILPWDFTFTEREMQECWRKYENHGRTRGLLP